MTGRLRRAHWLRARRARPAVPAASRRALEDHLDQLFSAARRGHHLTVLMVDVDHFTEIDETLGQEGGDVVLAAVAERIALAVRKDDMVGRWGGEEFLVLLPGTAEGEAVTVAQRIASGVRAPVLAGGRVQLPTVSVGLASFQPDDTPAALVGRADFALYQAKVAGRDQVVVSGTAPRVISPG